MSGELVEFDPQKIRDSLARTGARDELVDRVVQAVSAKIRDGMSTKKIFAIIRKEIAKTDTCVACRYTLREALIKFGPAGFKFEQYAAAVLSAYGYRTELPLENLRGKCTSHEVDVIATKDPAHAMIEAKFRNDVGDVVNLKDTMATWARFMDLNDAPERTQKFTDAWIVTNARFSESARQFGECKGMRLVGWKSGTESLAALVDHAAVYPITVLDDVRQWELDNFASKNLMLCRDIAYGDAATLAKKTGIPEDRMRRFVATCRKVTES